MLCLITDEEISIYGTTYSNDQVALDVKILKCDQMILNQFETGNQELARISFNEDEKIESVTRQTFTILDAITNTGGFMSIIFTAAQMIIGSIQAQLFYSSLLKKSFLTLDESKKEKSLKERSDTTFVDLGQLDDSCNIAKIANQDSNKEYSNSRQQQSLDENDYQWDFLNDDSTRTKASDKYKNVINQLKLFKQGKSKLESEFDISKIILKLRNLELLSQIMISKYQRTIIPYMSENILNLSKDQDKKT
ncbi:UNKNOWN [Stylonychia lemnae]|uniref:Uncharacterized protein n=1 Tax=Stylonychia lemnae TaxID=5949 RepID=A0A078B863_STYLE|nr:UNKNOWN [Stylonychia lemnae]|eukprot:CDW90594.1 UNKNOWN [Stylonychia lemnae]